MHDNNNDDLAPFVVVADGGGGYIVAEAVSWMETESGRLVPLYEEIEYYRTQDDAVEAASKL